MAVRVYVDTVDIPSPVEREPWMADGACLKVDPEKFFAGKKDKSTKEAKELCLTRCTVRLKCLAFIMFYERGDNLRRHGVWGGLDAGERRALQKQLDDMMKEKEDGQEEGND